MCAPDRVGLQTRTIKRTEHSLFALTQPRPPRDTWFLSDANPRVVAGWVNIRAMSVLVKPGARVRALPGPLAADSVASCCRRRASIVFSFAANSARCLLLCSSAPFRSFSMFSA